MLPTGAGAETYDWHLDMQLTSKVVLSAAALLLVTAAYKLYRSRPAPAGQAGRNNKADDDAEGWGQAAFQRASPGTLPRGTRRRKTSKGAGAPLDGSLEDPGDSCQLVTPGSGESTRKGSGENQGGQSPDSQQVPPPCGGQEEAGTAVRGKPSPPHLPHLGSEPISSPARLAPGVGCCWVGDKSAPWPDNRPPEQTGSGDPGAPNCCTDSTVVSSDMRQSWAFTHVTGVSRGEAGALQAAADMGLATQQREGATNASYTFSSVARIRMEENIIQKAEGPGPKLKGRVYDYFVESTSKAVSRPVPFTAALTDAPSPGPGPEPLVTGADSRDLADNPENTAEVTTPPPVPSPSTPGFSRKVSLLQIAENPELQLQPEGFRTPPPAHLDQKAQIDSDCSHGEPHVQLVAGTNFFHIQLTPASAQEVHLDLGNCFEVLTLAKRQGLEALKEAAYKVMSDNYLQVLRSTAIYGGLSGTERELILQRRFRGHKRLVVADVLGISVYRCNSSTRLWYECATYRLPYPEAFQCAVVDDHIYCVGRKRMLCFLADHISPRFVPKDLQGFPAARGTLLPAVLTLPFPDVPQTPV
ncbi:hypothetical protein ACRRTK_016349 [Alexandromys fortis]